MTGAIDALATPEQIEHNASSLPDEWLEPAATGSADSCAARVLHKFAPGAHSVIMHGADPGELAPVVRAYRRVRPPGRFEHLAANPGAVTPDDRRSATGPGGPSSG